MNWVAESAADLSLRQARDVVAGEDKHDNRNRLIERWGSRRGHLAGWGTHAEKWFWLYTLAPNGIESYKMFDTKIAGRAEFYAVVQRWKDNGNDEKLAVVYRADDASELSCSACGRALEA